MINMENQSTTDHSGQDQQINDTPPYVQTKTNSLMPILFSILVSGIIFGFGGYYLGKQSLQSQKYVNDGQTQVSPTINPQANNPTLTTNPSTVPDLSADWKTYKSDNSTSFKYPADIFIYPQNPTGGISVYMSNENGADSPLMLTSSGIMLDYIFYPNLSRADLSRVESVINASDGKILDNPINKGQLVKLKNLKTDGVDGALFQGLPDGNKDIKMFLAIWKKGDEVYNLRLTSFSENILDSNKSIFDQILSTFEFTN